ncbi:hypothetical protein GNI_153230 [Gregarina niphandrodes]|uniref:Uncharacterized protein n=1 Tax=Gregarina niphandrodes TaxID=110365 RepID=A0A023AZB6_GRENI|nr:hypothetical protein GNI_153230 [Gregarina niphandrodes]EZG44045.1 hypothetical protein GNI_153230 [Gregarina niphandrodes]|eukprot:XP_011132833.1 hypothetical protein GNI_153230 [Gregarina niphandrodes]
MERIETTEVRSGSQGGRRVGRVVTEVVSETIPVGKSTEIVTETARGPVERTERTEVITETRSEVRPVKRTGRTVTEVVTERVPGRRSETSRTEKGKERRPAHRVVTETSLGNNESAITQTATQSPGRRKPSATTATNIEIETDLLAVVKSSPETVVKSDVQTLITEEEKPVLLTANEELAEQVIGEQVLEFYNEYMKAYPNSFDGGSSTDHSV